MNIGQDKIKGVTLLNVSFLYDKCFKKFAFSKIVHYIACWWFNLIFWRKLIWRLWEIRQKYLADMQIVYTCMCWGAKKWRCFVHGRNVCFDFMTCLSIKHSNWYFTLVTTPIMVELGSTRFWLSYNNRKERKINKWWIEWLVRPNFSRVKNDLHRIRFNWNEEVVFGQNDQL